ncbi:MAG: phosphotransferase [Rhizobiaceae bacterium]|nr:phosphotransferase [Rhizobiaceae bacterium]
MADRAYGAPDVPEHWAVVIRDRLSSGVGGDVWLAEQQQGDRAVVKVPSIAARPDAGRAADYLRWRGGHGAVRLLDESGDLHLLEYAGPTRLLDHLHSEGDAAAASIAADVVAQLHAPSPDAAPASLTPLRTHFSSLLTRSAYEPLAGYAVLAGSLIAETREPSILHGDIHHENILLGKRGWLAIDPKGLIGDPAFDAANMFHNPVGFAGRFDADRIAMLAGVMSRALQRSPADILSWAIAYSGLSAAWWMEDGDDEAVRRTMAIGAQIRAVHADLSR